MHQQTHNIYIDDPRKPVLSMISVILSQPYVFIPQMVINISCIIEHVQITIPVY